MKITLGQHRRLAGELGKRAQDVWLMAADAGQEVVPENTTMKTNNKDVCYYASFNFPAFIWVTGQPEWHKFRALYMKLTSVSDI